ncbi:MAG: helix-turn-helix domain-containing protein [Marinobacter sp.]
MRSFSLILVKSSDAEPGMPGEGLQKLRNVTAIAPGSNLDLLIQGGSRVALIQPESWSGQYPVSIGFCQGLFRVIEDYLFRSRFFGDHEDAVIATDRLISTLRCTMNGSKAQEPVPELDRRLMHVIGKIEDEARWDFNLAELAAYAGLSERNLYYLMKRETGLTPYRLYQRQRLIRVRRHLVDCQCDAPHISWYAADEGFSHLGRFAALYRQHFGELPSETVQWRRLLGTKPEEAAETLAVY